MIGTELLADNRPFWQNIVGCQCNQTSCGSDYHTGHVVSEAGEQNFEAVEPNQNNSISHIEDILDISVNDLLVKYTMYVNSDTRIVSSGGLQQLMNKKCQTAAHNSAQRKMSMENQPTSFDFLPDSLQLRILQYMDPKDLCTISRVNTHWLMLASDDLLWQTLLKRDVLTWKTIGHTTYPEMFKDCQSDWTTKEIYLRCSPEINHLMRQENLNFHNLSSLLRSFLPRKMPKFAMFGPGLETSTSGITRRLLEDKTNIFTVKGMFPGQFEGLGSGFTLKTQSNVSFNLCTLYTSTKRERENMAAGERLQRNRLLVHNQEEGEEEEEGTAAASATHYEVRPAVRELCRTLDGFIFIIDATKDSQLVESSLPELKAMLNEMWADPNAPLVVLAAVRDLSQSALRQPVQIAEDLKLGNLNRPWQVQSCVVDTLEGIPDAIHWAVEAAQRR